MFEQPSFFRKHEINEVKRFIKQQNNALGYGFTKKLSHSHSSTPCHECQQLIDLDSTCIYIKRDNCTNLWHPQCFICTQCKKFLVNLIYFYKDGQLYCERHHSDLYKPRYIGCDLIIFSFESNKAEGHYRNMYQFFCFNCKICLNDERYIMRKRQLFCLNCFETMYLEYCDTCCERIEANQAQIIHESHQWHATKTCFCCYTCLIPLNNNDFLQDNGALFCSNKCALQIDNYSINAKLIEQRKIHQNRDIISTSFIYTNQHSKIFLTRSKNLKLQQQNILHERIKNQKGYLSNSIDIYYYNHNYQSPVCVQNQTSSNSIYSNEQKLNIIDNHSYELKKFYNDLNLEQIYHHDATLEIPRSSKFKSLFTSLTHSIHKLFFKSKIKNYPRVSQQTLIDQVPSNRFKSFHSNGIMSVISCPKSIRPLQFPYSSSLNDSSSLTKQYSIHLIDDEKEKKSKYLPIINYKSNSLCRSLSSSSSSSVHDNNQENFN
ncbi:unnamed protein product [Rotaria sp. Silwood1]|nr:unnamed protein product [Rotaria sp. Silwood1]